MSELLVFDGAYAFGVVENVVDDPLGINRIQVRLFGLHSDDPTVLPTEDLPWCSVLLPTTSNDGASHSVKKGMVVRCCFLDGLERQKPVVDSVLPGIVDSGESVLKNTDKTISKYADNRGITKKSKIHSSQPEDPYAAKYPHNRVDETPAGHRIEVDDTEGAERIHLYHKSGANIEFHPDGKIVIVAVSDMFNGTKTTHNMYAGKDLNIVVKGNSSIETDGKTSIKSKGDISANTESNITAKAKGNASLQAEGGISLKSPGNIDILAGGIVTINGQTIKLN